MTLLLEALLVLGAGAVAPPHDPPARPPASLGRLVLEVDGRGDGSYRELAECRDPWVRFRIRGTGGDPAGTYCALLSSVYVEEREYFQRYNEEGSRNFVIQQHALPFDALWHAPALAGFPALRVKEDSYWALYSTGMPPGANADRIWEVAQPMLRGSEGLVLTGNYYRWSPATRAWWRPVVRHDSGANVFNMVALLQQHFVQEGFDSSFFTTVEWRELIGRYTMVLVVQAVGFRGGSIEPSAFAIRDPGPEGPPLPGLFDWPRDEDLTGKTISGPTEFRLVLSQIRTRPRSWSGYPELPTVTVARDEPAVFPLIGLTDGTLARARFAGGDVRWLPVASAGPAKASVVFGPTAPRGRVEIDAIQTYYGRETLRDRADRPKFVLR